MRVAIVQDWLTGMRGGEKCLEVFIELFPNATLFTLLHNKGSVSPSIENLNIQTSFIQKLPLAEKKYRNYLPLFPTAVEELDLSGFDLILSSSHCVAKGIIPPPHALHICYCHTPMRYVWDMYQEYFGPDRVGKITRLILPLFSNYLRLWDVNSSARVDHFIANSEHVRRRIWRYYRREAQVIHAPVDTKMFSLVPNNDDYFLIVSALVPYKKIELAIKAFNHLEERLFIIGSGPMQKSLQQAANSNINFLGWQEESDLVRFYQGCRALIFPGEEDFGIVPLEAQACGKPVVAYGAGGALETVVDVNTKGKNPTGILFDQQTTENLVQSIQRFSKYKFDADQIRAHALQFDRDIFKQKMITFIEEKYEEHKKKK